VKQKLNQSQNIIYQLMEFPFHQKLIYVLLAIFLLMQGTLEFHNRPVYRQNITDSSMENSEKGSVPLTPRVGWLEGLPPGTTVYRVKKGDTLYWLSRRYFVSLTELQAVNHIRDSRRLAVNAQIYIPPVNYAVSNIQAYSCKPGDTRKGLCTVYHLEPWQWQRLNPGDHLSRTSPEFPSGQVVFLPRFPVFTGYQTPDRKRQSSSFLIIRPVTGRLSSRFGFRWGRMHSGIDLAAPAGTPVKAALTGKVIFAGWQGGYGLLVILGHGRVRTYYGHLSVILVKGGQTVVQGSTVGLVGATGRAYGSHLHFEVEQDGRKLNPLQYFTIPKN
jgi:murein DD-endopeptidase MepM/ murein hydrolase activator NlpD